jgi:hypothetical protein
MKKVSFYNECHIGDCIWSLTYFHSILEFNDINIVFCVNYKYFQELRELVHPFYKDRIELRPLEEADKSNSINTWFGHPDYSFTSNLNSNNHEINGMCFTMFKGLSQRHGIYFPMNHRDEFVFDHPWHYGSNPMLEKEGDPEFLFINSVPMSGQFSQNDDDLIPLYNFLGTKKTFVTKRSHGFSCTLDYGLNLLQIGQIAVKAKKVIGVNTGPLCACVNKAALKKNRDWHVLIKKSLPQVVYNRVDERFIVSENAQEVVDCLVKIIETNRSFKINV